MRQNEVTDDALRLYLFPYSLTHHATSWFDHLPRNSILSFDQMETKFLSKYFPPSMVIKLRNEIINFRQLPDELLFEAWEHYKLSIDRCLNHNMFPVTQIDTFYNGLTLRHRDTINAAAGGTFMKRQPEEFYDLIKNMTGHHNDWDTTVQRHESCSSLTSSNAEIEALKNELSEMNKHFLRMFQHQQVNSVTSSCETCGGPYSYHECQATGGHIQNVYDAGTYNQGGNTYQPQSNRNSLSYRSDNYLRPPGFNVNQNHNRNNHNQNYQDRNHGNNQGNNQGRNQFFQGASQVQNPNPNYQALAYQAPIHQPQIVTTSDFSNYMKANDAEMINMQTQMTSLTNSNIELKSMFGTFMKMNTASTSGSGPRPSNTIANLKGELKAITTRSGVSYEGPPISPLFSSLPKVVERVPEVTKDMKLREKDDKLALEFLEIFRKLHFDLTFTDALLHMPKFSTMFKSLLNNKEKLFDLATTPVNENCSAIILKKLLEKLGDPDKFLIPCDFLELVECLALADLGASINLMPLSIWDKLSLPELTPTQMILELADRSTTRPAGIAEDVFVKVGKIYFLTDFVVVDYVVDPRVSLILGRPFLRTGRALIDVYDEKLTLRVDDEAITFKVGQTLKYSYNDAESINQVDVIDVACEEYFQEVLGFLEISKSGNLTPVSDPIVALSSPSLTPFEGGDFNLEEIKACLASKSIPSRIDDTDFDPKGDILLLEKLLNDDPSSPLPPKELNLEELKTVKSSIDDPPQLELKDLPSHLEYAFLEDADKLPVIIAKNLKDDEKARILKVLKSYKRAIAWKLFDIKGSDPQFCTHKILMEHDFKPVVQHQRRVNPKIYKVIKKEVIKLLDAGLIYPIFDSPWVSLVHCVPRKGGMTIVTNDDDELIPTRLVTGWRVCIDYRKLNDATRKDHFPLPFMDQMLERLAKNEFY
uniref:DNA-directed DNA polymerase n=1 Tax=Tanacetum cinerariifolium TaxID=118510 RepID=A0A6L2NQW4_TANCI|nr:DNA-directed DNA polymerase [Tanacetum cinerariifolium]